MYPHEVSAMRISYLCLLGILTQVLAKLQMFNYHELQGLSNMYNRESSLKTYTISSLLQCSCECSVTSDCLSFFFSATRTTCILHSTVITSDTLTTENHWIYFSKEKGKDCPLASGFVYYKDLNLCYKIVNTKLNWKDSESACREDSNGTLVKIDSQPKQIYFEDVFNTSGVSNTFNTPANGTNEYELTQLYWIPNLHKNPYKSRYIAGSSKCSTNPLSLVHTEILTVVKTNFDRSTRDAYSSKAPDPTSSVSRVSEDFHIGLQKIHGIGGSDLWQWLDGTRLDNTQAFWDGSVDLRYQCVVLNHNFHFLWDAVDCFKKGGYICEIYV